MPVKLPWGAVKRCVGAGIFAIAMFSLGTSPAQATLAPNAKADCVYSSHSIAILHQFDQLVGANVSCAQVYINATSTWSQWDSPWMINYYDPDMDWSQWATAPGTHRQLIITQSLAPSSVTSQSNWAAEGASGAFTRYARVLAQKLVAAGLGGSVIRLSPECNGTWNADSLGSGPAQWAQWDQFWRETVDAMRSIPGAHFQFDFNVNALYRALPLSEIYPGNKWVNIVSVDAYDNGNLGTTAGARWNEIYNGLDGIGTVVKFAKAHGKSIAIPEWGVAPVSDDNGFGDDPTFVNGIASVVRDNKTAYQSYFYKYGNATQLADGPGSLAAYRRDFGMHGSSVGRQS
jgi:Glycosyl hydrolase family 26